MVVKCWWSYAWMRSWLLNRASRPPIIYNYDLAGIGIPLFASTWVWLILLTHRRIPKWYYPMCTFVVYFDVCFHIFSTVYAYRILFLSNLGYSQIPSTPKVLTDGCLLNWILLALQRLHRAPMVSWSFCWLGWLLVAASTWERKEVVTGSAGPIPTWPLHQELPRGEALAAWEFQPNCPKSPCHAIMRRLWCNSSCSHGTAWAGLSFLNA